MRSTNQRRPSSGFGAAGSTPRGSIPNGTTGWGAGCSATHVAQSSGYLPTGPRGNLRGLGVELGREQRTWRRQLRRGGSRSGEHEDHDGDWQAQSSQSPPRKVPRHSLACPSPGLGRPRESRASRNDNERARRNSRTRRRPAPGHATQPPAPHPGGRRGSRRRGAVALRWVQHRGERRDGSHERAAADHRQPASRPRRSLRLAPDPDAERRFPRRTAGSASTAPSQRPWSRSRRAARSSPASGSSRSATSSQTLSSGRAPAGCRSTTRSTPSPPCCVTRATG